MSATGEPARAAAGSGRDDSTSRLPARAELDLTILIPSSDDDAHLDGAAAAADVVSLTPRPREPNPGVDAFRCEPGARLARPSTHARDRNARAVRRRARRRFLARVGRVPADHGCRLSHPPEFVERSGSARADVDDRVPIRAWRPRGHGVFRYAVSRILNAVFSRGLDVPIRDLSSGFRLYRSAVIREQHITSRDSTSSSRRRAGIAEGWQVREVPFTYTPHPTAAPHDAGFALERLYAHVRSALDAAQLDPRRRLRDRAHDSRISLQRTGSGRDYRHVTEPHRRRGTRARRGMRVEPDHRSCQPGASPSTCCIASCDTRGAWTAAPPRVGLRPAVRDESFPCVLCSQVIEHVPKESPILDELCRVLQPGGRLVLGTPDYANWQWV